MQTLFTPASTGSRGGVAASFSSSCDFIALYSVLLPLHLAAAPLRRMCCRILVAPAPPFHGQNLHCTKGLTSSSSFKMITHCHSRPLRSAAARLRFARSRFFAARRVPCHQPPLRRLCRRLHRAVFTVDVVRVTVTLHGQPSGRIQREGGLGEASSPVVNTNTLYSDCIHVRPCI